MRFSKRTSRLCALGLLLLWKAQADEEGVVSFSQRDFANWLGIRQTQVSTTFDELELFDFMKRIKAGGEQSFVWSGRIVGKRMGYRIQIKTENSGNYIIVNNDIRALYHSVFD